MLGVFENSLNLSPTDETKLTQCVGKLSKNEKTDLTPQFQ